jgi:hypothetical protein
MNRLLVPMFQSSTDTNRLNQRKSNVIERNAWGGCAKAVALFNFCGQVVPPAWRGGGLLFPSQTSIFCRSRGCYGLWTRDCCLPALIYPTFENTQPEMARNARLSLPGQAAAKVFAFAAICLWYPTDARMQKVAFTPDPLPVFSNGNDSTAGPRYTVGISAGVAGHTGRPVSMTDYNGTRYVCYIPQEDTGAGGSGTAAEAGGGAPNTPEQLLDALGTQDLKHTSHVVILVGARNVGAEYVSPHCVLQAPFAPIELKTGGRTRYATRSTSASTTLRTRS